MVVSSKSSASEPAVSAGVPVASNATGTRRREAWLDLGRVIWIVAIILYHYFRSQPGLVGKVSGFGGQGVYFFLFASGYGLARSRSSDLPYGEFLQRRLLKVMLPFWVVAALFVVLSIPLGWGVPNEQTLWAALGLSGFLNAHVPTAWWFITGILQCYLVFPLLLRFANRPWPLLSTVTLLFLARAAFGAWLSGRVGDDLTFRSLPAVLPAFAAGVIAGRCGTDLVRLASKGWVVAAVLAAEIASALLTLKSPLFKNFNDLFFIPFAVALPLWIEGLWLRPRSVDVRLSWAPAWSMAVFLTHEWSMKRLAPIRHEHAAIGFGLFLLATLAVSLLTMPILNFFQGRRTAPAPTG